MSTLRTLLALVILATTALAFDPPQLEKADAKKLLEHVDWREVTVIAIHQGLDAKGTAAPIYATILGLGTRDNQHTRICQTLTFDKDLGWHLLELGDKSARIWTKDGYREIKQWTTY